MLKFERTIHLDRTRLAESFAFVFRDDELSEYSSDEIKEKLKEFQLFVKPGISIEIDVESSDPIHIGLILHYPLTKFLEDRYQIDKYLKDIKIHLWTSTKKI